MGISTDGQLCFGIMVPEDSWETAWFTDEYDCDYWMFMQKEDPDEFFEVVNYCSCDEPLYIIAIADSCSTAHRGYPMEMDSLPEISAADHNRLIDFFQKHFPDAGDIIPKWYLSSYCG